MKRKNKKEARKGRTTKKKKILKYVNNLRS